MAFVRARGVGDHVEEDARARSTPSDKVLIGMWSPEACRNFESCFRLLPPLAPQVDTINTVWYGNRTCGRLLIVTTPPSGASHPHTLRRSRRRERSPSLSVAWWPIHDFFFHPETHRTDWWTIVIFLATVASFAGAAILWVQHSG
jgi:hypothetical protein